MNKTSYSKMAAILAFFYFLANRKTLDSNDQNQVADQRFSLKQCFAGVAQSRGLRKPGCGHCYLRFLLGFLALIHDSRHVGFQIVMQISHVLC